MSAPNEVFWSVLQTGKVPGLAIGHPGSGKTKTIEAFGRAVNREAFVVIASIREPSDFGVPFLVKSVRSGRVIKLVPPEFLDKIWQLHDQGRYSVLFLDELTTCSPAQQTPLLGMLVEKKVADEPLPPSTWICSACNPPGEAANGCEIEPPVANRLYHHPWESDKDVWEQGFIHGWEDVVPRFTILPPDWENGIGRVAANLSAFLRRFPSHWEKMPEDRNKRGGPWPSRRTWEMAKIALAAVESHSPRENDLRLRAVAGCVGEDVAHEWSAWDKTLDLPDPEVVLRAVMAAMAAGRPVNGEVPQLARADQALTFLGAMADRVVHHDLRQERWEAGMEIMGSFWTSWKELSIVCGKSMAVAMKRGWRIPPKFLSEAVPLMQRAGMFKKVGV